MTKYVCMVEGCDFVAEEEQDAIDHIGSHPDDPNAALAEVSYDPDQGTMCSTFEYKVEEA